MIHHIISFEVTWFMSIPYTFIQTLSGAVCLSTNCKYTQLVWNDDVSGLHHMWEWLCTHVPVILHSNMCNIDNIGYPLSQHYCVNLHIFCSSLSPPLLSFSFDQLFGSLSVHVTAGVHIGSSVLYHDVIYCSLQWERVQRMSQFGHRAKISGPNQNLLVHLQSLSDPKE